MFNRSSERVRRVLPASKLADSSSTVLVPLSISVLAPPMTPASPTLFSGSAITSMGGDRSRFSPSSVTCSSPSCAARTIIVLSFTLSKSKA